MIKMCEKVVLVIGMVLLVPIFMVSCSFSPWALIYSSIHSSATPPKPNVTYGEFPFKLVYEKNGERVEINDVLVIEYLGVGFNEGTGKYNKWKTYYKSNPSNVAKDPVLFDGFVKDVGGISIKLELGSCEYYMGLEEVEGYYIDGIDPGSFVISYPGVTRMISEEELYNNYKINIIEKYIAAPIK